MANPISGQQGMPRLNTPVVNPDTGLPAEGWYKLFVYLWQKASAVPAVVAGPAGTVQAPASPTTIFVPVGGGGGGGGGAPSPAPVGAPGPSFVVAVAMSPTQWRAPSGGALIVTGAEVELSRDGLAWTVVTVAGGAIPMEAADYVRVSWYGAVAPKATFFPRGV